MSVLLDMLMGRLYQRPLNCRACTINAGNICLCWNLAGVKCGLHSKQEMNKVLKNQRCVAVILTNIENFDFTMRCRDFDEHQYFDFIMRCRDFDEHSILSFCYALP